MVMVVTVNRYCLTFGERTYATHRHHHAMSTSGLNWHARDGGDGCDRPFLLFNLRHMYAFHMGSIVTSREEGCIPLGGVKESEPVAQPY